MALSVDVVCFAVLDGALSVLVVRRATPPFAGQWALPGGVVQEDEPLDAAADRILTERTGVTSAYLEQLYTFGDPRRDPRGRTLSVAYYSLLVVGEHPLAVGRGVSDVAWHRVDDLPVLAFDHARIVAYARQRLAQKLDYAPIAFRVLPETFSMPALLALHEAILGRKLPHYSNFVATMKLRWGLVAAEETGGRRPGGRGRAALYRYPGPREIPGPPPTRTSEPPPTRTSKEEETR